MSKPFEVVGGVSTWRPRITPEVLLAAGYKFFDNAPFERDKPSYRGSYQKRFDDADGKRYFITFTHHHWTDATHDWPSMEMDAYYKRDGADFKIETLQTFASDLPTLEAIAADVWRLLRCDYYERFDCRDEKQVAND